MKGNQKVLSEEGTMIELIDDFGWQNTSLGDREYWPDSLKLMVNTCLHSKSALSILWGKDLIQIYNEAYSKIIGLKHPAALGASAREVWSEIWDEIGPMLRTVLMDGESLLLQDHPFILNRKGMEEKCYFTFSYSPIISAAKKIEGVLVTAVETTDNVLQGQKIRMLRDTQLRNLFIQAPVGMAILRGPNHIVEIANERILQIWGKSSIDVMNRPVFEAIPEAMKQGYEEMLEEVMQEGKRIVLESSPLTITRHDRKEEILLKLNYEPLREEGGTISGIMIVADDITEQVNARKKIEESELRLKIALEAAEMGTFAWHIPASSFDFSARLAQMFGYTETTGLKQTDFSERIHPDDRELRLQAHKEAFERGTLDYEARV
ncbi:MAG TPA: PAS domain S-box protein, partial [Flavitalea sp.]|nr:PAS domain S-box protein [Flavitalea sp.]